MRIRQFVTATLQAGLIFSATIPAYAGGRFGEDSDILGMRLTMSQDEATALVEQSFPGAQIIQLPVALNVKSAQKKAVSGFMADIVSNAEALSNQTTTEQQQAEQAAKQAAGLGDSALSLKVGKIGDFARDRVKVLFNPNDGARDILGISRYTEFATGRQPVTRTVIEALTEKYGPPSRIGGDSRTLISYTWAAPGVLERTRSSTTHCYEDAGSDFLYENIGEGALYRDRQMINANSESFVRIVNMILGKNQFRNYAICGTILQVRLKLTSNGDYVGIMGARLLALSRAYSELSQFGESVLRGADSQRQQQLNQDKSNKPRL